jgi:hypothetical protein
MLHPEILRLAGDLSLHAFAVYLELASMQTSRSAIEMIFTRLTSTIARFVQVPKRFTTTAELFRPPAHVL